jgi:putative glutathione S-transferase
MDQIKLHYFCSHPELNKFSIVPKGTGFEELLRQPHNRDAFCKKRKIIDSAEEEKKDAL